MRRLQSGVESFLISPYITRLVNQQSEGLRKMSPNTSEPLQPLSSKGRAVPLSLPRRWICDLLHASRQVPTVPVERRIDIRGVVAARAALAQRPSWAAIFIRAYALVAREIPELRRAYLSFPWPHLYEFPYSIASVAIERDYCGEKAVFFGHLRSPETQTIASLDKNLKEYKEKPIGKFGLFRRALQIAKYPRFLRRFVWWFGLNVNGAKRAKRLGTFGLSVYSGLGSESLHPLSPLTTTLNYGVIEEGRVTVRVVYDHRVMDGGTVARAQARLEEVMNRDIVDELRSLYAKAA
jgi:hypothetical protein